MSVAISMVVVPFSVIMVTAAGVVVSVTCMHECRKSSNKQSRPSQSHFCLSFLSKRTSFVKFRRSRRRETFLRP